MEKYKVENENCRLDKYIADKDDRYSRTIIQKMIEDGKVLVNGKAAKSSYKVVTGDLVTIENAEPKEDLKLKPQKIAACVLGLPSMHAASTLEISRFHSVKTRRPEKR